MTQATVTQPSDTEPHEWSQALELESAVGVWIDLLDDPDGLEARAVWLRTDDELDERDALEDLIARLSEFVDDPDRLEARAVALRAAVAAGFGRRPFS